jgi:toxin ParE1/3/4
VPKYKLSRLALADLKAIGRYTVQNWGRDQADRYIDEFRTLLGTLAQNPNLGRSCEEIREGYRRMEHRSHVVFYRNVVGEDVVEVIRILHRRMLPQKHLGEK